MTRQRVNQRTLTIAELTRQSAPTIQAAIDELWRQEQNDIAIWKANTIGDGTSPSSETVTQPERALIAIDRIRNQPRHIAALLDALDGCRKDLEDEANHILQQAARIRGIPLKKTPRCDARHLDGYELPLVTGGWSDPTCERIPRAGQTGPCDACYMRHVRWRTRTGRQPLDDKAPAR